MENIVLIGFTACGKSTTAALIARNSARKMIDLDSVIAQLDQEAKDLTEPRTCRDIFHIDGVDYFRELENTALKILENESNVVISTGGGAAIVEENKQLIKKLRRIVCLRANVKILFERMVRGKGLPAYLFDNPTPEGLEEVYAAREPIYESQAEFTFDTDDASPEEIAQKILQSIDK